MRTEPIERCVTELLEEYEGAQETTEGGVRYVKLPLVKFPRGCDPADTEALVVFNPAEQLPNLLVRRVPKTPGGATPRNVSPVPVLGESWNQYSFKIQWNEDRHTAVQFVDGRLRRFALDE